MNPRTSAPGPKALASMPMHKFRFELDASADTSKARRASYCDQGDDGMAGDTAVRARSSIRHDPAVVHALDNLWTLYVADKNGLVAFDEYCRVHTLMTHATSLLIGREEARLLAVADWHRDTSGETVAHLTKERGLASFFEVSDLWTYSTETSEYVEFLEELLYRVKEQSSVGQDTRENLRDANLVDKRKEVVLDTASVTVEAVLDTDFATGGARLRHVDTLSRDGPLDVKGRELPVRACREQHLGSTAGKERLIERGKAPGAMLATGGEPSPWYPDGSDEESEYGYSRGVEGDNDGEGANGGEKIREEDSGKEVTDELTSTQRERLWFRWLHHFDKSLGPLNAFENNRLRITKIAEHTKDRLKTRYKGTRRKVAIRPRRYSAPSFRIAIQTHAAAEGAAVERGKEGERRGRQREMKAMQGEEGTAGKSQWRMVKRAIQAAGGGKLFARQILEADADLSRRENPEHWRAEFWAKGDGKHKKVRQVVSGAGRRARRSSAELLFDPWREWAFVEAHTRSNLQDCPVNVTHFRKMLSKETAAVAAGTEARASQWDRPFPEPHDAVWVPRLQFKSARATATSTDFAADNMFNVVSYKVATKPRTVSRTRKEAPAPAPAANASSHVHTEVQVGLEQRRYESAEAHRIAREAKLAKVRQQRAHANLRIDDARLQYLEQAELAGTRGASPDSYRAVMKGVSARLELALGSSRGSSRGPAMAPRPTAGDLGIEVGEDGPAKIGKARDDIQEPEREKGEFPVVAMAKTGSLDSTLPPADLEDSLRLGDHHSGRQRDRRVLKERLSHLLFAEKTEIYQTHAKGRWAERVQEHREHVIQLKWQQEDVRYRMQALSRSKLVRSPMTPATVEYSGDGLTSRPATGNAKTQPPPSEVSRPTASTTRVPTSSRSARALLRSPVAADALLRPTDAERSREKTFQSSSADLRTGGGLVVQSPVTMEDPVMQRNLPTSLVYAEEQDAIEAKELGLLVIPSHIAPRGPFTRPGTAKLRSENPKAAVINNVTARQRPSTAQARSRDKPRRTPPLYNTREPRERPRAAGQTGAARTDGDDSAPRQPPPHLAVGSTEAEIQEAVLMVELLGASEGETGEVPSQWGEEEGSGLLLHREVIGEKPMSTDAPVLSPSSRKISPTSSIAARSHPTSAGSQRSLAPSTSPAISLASSLTSLEKSHSHSRPGSGTYGQFPSRRMSASRRRLYGDPAPRKQPIPTLDGSRLSVFSHAHSLLFYNNYEPLGEGLQGDVEYEGIKTAHPLMTTPTSYVLPHSQPGAFEGTDVPIAISPTEQRLPEPVLGASLRAPPLIPTSTRGAHLVLDDPTSQPPLAVLDSDPPSLEPFHNRFPHRTLQQQQSVQLLGRAREDLSSKFYTRSLNVDSANEGEGYLRESGSGYDGNWMSQYSPRAGQSRHRDEESMNIRKSSSKSDVEEQALKQALRRYTGMGVLPGTKMGATKVVNPHLMDRATRERKEQQRLVANERRRGEAEFEYQARHTKSNPARAPGSIVRGASAGPRPRPQKGAGITETQEFSDPATPELCLLSTMRNATRSRPFSAMPAASLRSVSAANRASSARRSAFVPQADLGRLSVDTRAARVRAASAQINAGDPQAEEIAAEPISMRRVLSMPHRMDLLSQEQVKEEDEDILIHPGGVLRAASRAPVTKHSRDTDTDTMEQAHGHFMNHLAESKAPMPVVVPATSLAEKASMPQPAKRGRGLLKGSASLPSLGGRTNLIRIHSISGMQRTVR